jgi:hypothetical protein
MKRTMFFSLLAFGLATLVSAQAWNRQGMGSSPRVPAEKVTVTGSLTIAQGMIAVKSDNITYLLPGLNRYVGFIDSLKDGASVKAEGSAMGRSPEAQTKVLMISKLTIGGKEYDLAQPSFGGGSWQGNSGPYMGQHGMMRQNGKNSSPNYGQHGRSGNQGRRR